MSPTPRPDDAPPHPPRPPRPVGYVGLGNMGAPMAHRLVAWPGGLRVCDVRAESVAPLVEAGAAEVSLAELARTCAVISVTVLDDAQVREVVAGPEGLLAHAPAGREADGGADDAADDHEDGLVIAVHSTIADTTAEELAALCAERGVGFVDAPVSGGAQGAKDGNLATMVGASEADFAATSDVFRHWAGLVVHAGPPGAGTRMKLARNLLHFVSFTATGEAARLAEASGLSVTALGEVVRHTDAITGGAGAIMYRDTTAPIPEGDFWEGVFGHVRGLGEKDLDLALRLGAREGVDLPLAARALRDLGTALGLGPGEIARGTRPTPETHASPEVPAEGFPGDAATVRAEGLRRMSEVYGFDMADGPGAFFAHTADHLFANVWNRQGLTDRDRRLLLLGALAASGDIDVAEIQVGAALDNGELDAGQLAEAALFLCYYVGWPRGTKLNALVGKVAASRGTKHS